MFLWHPLTKSLFQISNSYIFDNKLTFNFFVPHYVNKLLEISCTQCTPMPSLLSYKKKEETQPFPTCSSSFHHPFLLIPPLSIFPNIESVIIEMPLYRGTFETYTFDKLRVCLVENILERKKWRKLFLCVFGWKAEMIENWWDLVVCLD